MAKGRSRKKAARDEESDTRRRAAGQEGPTSSESASEDQSPPSRLEQLQQTHGNAFVQRLVVQRAPFLSEIGQAVGAGPAAGESTTVDWPKVTSTAISAASDAVTTWKSLASLTGVTVNAVTAVGGKLVGPALGPLVRAGMAASGAPPDVLAAFSEGIGRVWAAWAASVKVPGLPWYPAFAAVPSPVAPATPNVPSPLLALSAVPITAAALETAILGRLPGPKEAERDQAVRNFATSFVISFNIMLASTMVTNVLGTGPVPTFAPPYVPVGPVVGGTANGPPGCLAGGAMIPLRTGATDRPAGKAIEGALDILSLTEPKKEDQDS
jgi:hypothetical protein